MAEPSTPTVATYAASAGTVAAGSLTANEIAAYGGLALAVATFLVNWYYKHLERKDKRDALRKGSSFDSSD